MPEALAVSRILRIFAKTKRRYYADICTVLHARLRHRAWSIQDTRMHRQARMASGGASVPCSRRIGWRSSLLRGVVAIDR